MRVFDGLRNLVANLGTWRDKAAHSGYYFVPLTGAELLVAYRTSAIARKIIDIPADDAVREWREWQAEGDQISDIEAEEKRLGLVEKVRKATKLARLYGGSAIYIGTGETNPAKELQPESVRKGGLQYLTVLPMARVSAKEIQRDPREPGFGKPVAYMLEGGVEVHPSRMVVLHGADLPDDDFGGAWGDSILQSTLESVKAVDGIAANILSMTFESKIDVIRVPGFMDALARRSSYTNDMLERVSLAARGKGINGTLLLDKEEEFEQKQISFGGLHEIWDRFMLTVAASADIPATRLWGQSPAGMNATGEADEANYHAKVGALQKGQIEPAMGLLDECLIRSALGGRPTEVHYNWRSLWQPTSQQKAETADKLMSAAEKLHRLDAVSPEAIGKTATNALVECGAFPGLESAVEEFPAVEAGAEESGLIQRDGVTATDAEPRTLYMHRKVVNADAIVRWAKAQGFKTTLPAGDMHVTIAFSRTPLDWMKVGESWQEKLEIGAGGPRQMERFGDARVLLFASSDLAWRHESIKEVGASWDHPEYQPHITISYDPDAPDIGDIEPYQGPIILGPEVFAELDEGWAGKLVEE